MGAGKPPDKDEFEFTLFGPRLRARASSCMSAVVSGLSSTPALMREKRHVPLIFREHGVDPAEDRRVDRSNPLA